MWNLEWKLLVSDSQTFPLNLFHHVLLLSWPKTKTPTGVGKQLKLCGFLQLALIDYTLIVFEPKGSHRGRYFGPPDMSFSLHVRFLSPSCTYGVVRHLWVHSKTRQIVLKRDSPQASGLGLLGRNMCGGRGYSHACIYTSGTDRDCSHMTDIWTESRAEERRRRDLLLYSNKYTREQQLNKSNYVCIQYSFQQSANQCRLFKSIRRN